MVAKSRIVLLLCGALAMAFGCHRQYYRKQADQEVRELIQEKSSHIARPSATRLDINIDPRSRMYNPFDLDFQPIPVDDPASNRYMQCVDGRRGYPLWEAAGITNSAENPDWWEFLPLDEDGVLVLNSETAYRLALVHSTGYQQQLEQLYLSALDVSSERFLLDTQLFFNSNGGQGFAFPDPGSDSFSTGTSVGFTRPLATGGTIVASLANSIVWDLGSGGRVSTTPLSFNIVQPLLRGGGRDVTLERLTRAERQLLANVRAFERYRRSFYLNITIGRGIESTVSRSGGVFGVGLQGFTGLGGGFAGLGGGGGGGVGGGGGGVPQAGGFLGLLQDQLEIQNSEENIARLSESLLVLENTLIELLTTIPDDPEAIVRQRLQIAQSKSQLLASQRGLVGAKRNYQASIDGFLGTLGLPPYICARIEDPMLDRFQLIERDLRDRRSNLLSLRSSVGSLNVRLLEQAELETDEETGLPVSKLAWSGDVAQILAELREELAPLEESVDQFRNDDAKQVGEDIAELVSMLPKRRKQNQKLREMYNGDENEICQLLGIERVDDTVLDITELESIETTLGESLEKLTTRLDEYPARLEKIFARLDDYIQSGPGDASPEDLAKDIRDNVVLAIQDTLSELGDDVLSLQLVQARARTEGVVLATVDIDPAAALEIARKNRRDWANARASLVDAYRLIAFNADQLESVLTLNGGGSITGTDINPFSGGSSSSNFTLGFQWDSPITRLLERNAYRQSLIDYDRAKRGYYQFEDGIWQLLRAQIRQLQANQVLFEYNRNEVRIAANQIELNEDIRLLRDSRGLNSGPTAAQDTIRALDALLTAQNSLLGVYVNFEVVRRGLEFDLGTMEITDDGMWIDPGELDPDYLLSLPGTTYENVPEGCTDCRVPFRHQAQPPQYYDVLISDPGMIESPGATFEAIETLPLEQAIPTPMMPAEVPAPTPIPDTTS
ncbi:MAG: hypothetical protein AAFX06_28070 [Planctomycetota bacterium]